MSWLSQYFLHPGFVLPWGVALLAVPVVIHLLNRLRYRRVRFAAMTFLLQSQHRHRRRLWLEQLLLLVARVLVVAVVLLLVARLVLDPAQLSIFRGATVHHVVLLDDSGSMQDRRGEKTAFQEAVEVVRKLAGAAQHSGGVQQLTLMLASEPLRPLSTERRIDALFVRELDVKLDNLKCRHGRCDLAAGIDAARRLLADQPETIQQLHIVGDFRAADWLERPDVAASVRAAAEAGLAVNLVKTVPRESENLAITELDGDLQVAAAGVPLRLRVTVKNFRSRAAEQLRLTLTVDGRSLPRSLVFERIDPGGETLQEFDVVFDSPGRHTVQVSLPADALAADNVRHLAVDVAPAIRVLIVDGELTGDEAFYVATALAADPATTGYAATIESVEGLQRRRLEEFGCVYLLNIPELPAEAVEQLQQFVADGGGLAWFLGPAVRPAFYNEVLYRPGGEGLFPVRLAETRPAWFPRDATQPGPDLQFGHHPIFERTFLESDNPFVSSVTVAAWLPTADDWNVDDNQRRDGVRTIAFVRNRRPLMFAHRFGRGRVVTCLTSAGPAWNNWAPNPSFVLLHLELAKELVSRRHVPPRQVVGEPITAEFQLGEYRDQVEISTPERLWQQRADPLPSAEHRPGAAAEGTSPADAAQPERALSGMRSLSFPETDVPGIYRLRLFDPQGKPHERWLAFNVPVEESDLRLAGTAQLRERIGADVAVQIHEPGAFDWVRGQDAGQDVRRLLLFVLVGLLCTEQVLACRFTHHAQEAETAA